MAATSCWTLDGLLKATSRSFYLTLRVLPRSIRPQIGLAYLLARTTDTIADTEVLPIAERLMALERLRNRITGNTRQPLDFSRVTQDSKTGAAERALLERVEDALGMLARFQAADRQRISQVLDMITSGQQLDLERFAAASAEHIIALASDDALDDYTYRVAGCVGEFWTKMCRAHLFPAAELDNALLLENGVRFGKGLQLVNILRDLPADLHLGRCYIPEPRLAAQSLAPSDLLSAATEPRFRPLYDSYLDLAQGHLSAGWSYTNMLPRGQARLRLACAWPILIGRKTIEKLRVANILDGAHRVKVSRSEVRQIVTRSLLWYPWPRTWRRLFAG